MKEFVKYSLLSFFVCCISPVKAQDDKEFEEFVKNRQKEYQEFHENRQAEFALFLETRWNDYQLMLSDVKPDIAPLPITPAPPVKLNSIPIEIKAIPSTPKRPRVAITLPLIQRPILPDPAPTIKVEPQKDPNLKPIAPVKPSESVPVEPTKPLAKPILKPTPEEPLLTESAISPIKDPNNDRHTITFFGNRFVIDYDKAFDNRLASIDEQSVANFWKILAKSNYQAFLYACQAQQQRYALNGWGYYQLIKHIASQIYGEKRLNEQAVFTAFMLDEIGYDVRVGLVNNSELKLMLTSDYGLFDLLYLTIDNKKYYVIGENRRVKLRTYKTFDNKVKKPIDLLIAKSVNFATTATPFKVKERTMLTTQKLIYNKNMIDFYNTMPQTEFEVYFNSKGSTEIEQTLFKELKQSIKGKSQIEAANILLRFVQFGFEYATDRKQFGVERSLFYEELLAYPYSDCEDRAILFSHLIRNLLNLPVIGLSYPTHMATAVLFDENSKGDFITFNNKKYTVCDPTFYGAMAGQSMPGYKELKAEIIPID